MRIISELASLTGIGLFVQLERMAIATMNFMRQTVAATIVLAALQPVTEFKRILSEVTRKYPMPTKEVTFSVTSELGTLSTVKR